MFVQFFVLMKRKKNTDRNIFHWVWIVNFYVFAQEEPNPPRKLGGGVYALGPPPPLEKFGGFFMLSWPLRGAKILQENLGGFFFLHGHHEKMNLARKFFGGVYCLFKEVFSLGSIFKELILLMWLLGVQQVS